MMFSKRVQRFLDDGILDYEIEKPLVMKLAIEFSAVEQIESEPFRELLRNIEALLKK